MALTAIFSFLLNLVLIQGRTELGTGLGFRPDNSTHFDVYASALSKAHYNPWVCDYRSEPGYKCLSCSSALHCFPGNFALLVQCAGVFSFCRNGYCARFKTEGCIEDADPNIVSHSSTFPPFVQVFHKGNKTTETSDTTTNSSVEINDSIPQESSSNTIATQLNDPNKISGGIATSTNASNMQKPKDSS